MNSFTRPALAYVDPSIHPSLFFWMHFKVTGITTSHSYTPEQAYR